MTTNTKKYYWIKLQTNFFNLDEIDFILSQKNGCEYIVLYQMLCLNTANCNGRLETSIGEFLVPYDCEKIARDTKHFDVDTVVVALELFKKVGLIYEEENKILKLANFESMVGSESKYAEEKRNYRAKQKLLQQDILLDNDKTLSDKSIEYRDKSIDIELDNIVCDNNAHAHENICHLKSSFKNESCTKCQKKQLCKNQTSNEFIVVHNCTFEEYDKKRDAFYRQWVEDREANGLPITEELFDYDWLNDRSE